MQINSQSKYLLNKTSSETTLTVEIMILHKSFIHRIYFSEAIFNYIFSCFLFYSMFLLCHVVQLCPFRDVVYRWSTFWGFPWWLYLADRKRPRNPCSAPTERERETHLHIYSISCPSALSRVVLGSALFIFPGIFVKVNSKIVTPHCLSLFRIFFFFSFKPPTHHAPSPASEHQPHSSPHEVEDCSPHLKFNLSVI